VQAQFVNYIKNYIRELYGLLGDATAIARRVKYLLEDDRFMCPGNGYEMCIRQSPVTRRPLPNQDFQSQVTMTCMQAISVWFLGPPNTAVIYGNYFNCKTKLRMLDKEFINGVNGTMVCLTCEILCHKLRA